MIDCPSVLIEFDPMTWKINAIYFKASTDTETTRLRDILLRGLRLDIAPAGDTYDS